DMGAWTPIAYYSTQRFESSDDALSAARSSVRWLAGMLDAQPPAVQLPRLVDLCIELADAPPGAGLASDVSEPLTGRGLGRQTREEMMSDPEFARFDTPADPSTAEVRLLYQLITRANGSRRRESAG